MTRSLRYRLVDVFTDRPFAGNALAVFADANGLSEDEMQTLAEELNLAESAFVLDVSDEARAAGADYRLRLFTPGTELPFAGHPTIGTAWALAQAGKRRTLRLELAVGVLHAAIDGPHVTLTTTTPEVVLRLEPDAIQALAAALGLDRGDLCWPAAPDAPAVISCGTPYLVVPFARIEALTAVDARQALAAVAVAKSHGADLAMVAPGSAGVIANADVHVRVMSDPSVGPLEDAATGSAAIPICAFVGLAERRRNATERLVIEQGVEMGRPSRLETEVEFDSDGSPRAARLGGAVVPVGEGWIEL